MSESILKDRTYTFALKVIEVYKQILVEHKEFVLSKQLLKAGTSIGALVREAEFGQSKPDFISKMSIALKEANECEYWISLLKDANYISESLSAPLLQENKELIYMLIASIKKAKNNL